MYVFLAADLHPEPLDGDVDEFISVERLPVETAYRMAADGRIRDAKTLAGLFLARPHLKGTAIRAGDPPKG
jgi:ADP-ribose pyrophosphatase